MQDRRLSGLSRLCSRGGERQGEDEGGVEPHLDGGTMSEFGGGKRDLRVRFVLSLSIGMCVPASSPGRRVGWREAVIIYCVNRSRHGRLRPLTASRMFSPALPDV